MSRTTILRNLGTQEYVPLWQQMQQFNAERTPNTADEIWITEHPAVYTLGLNGKPEHLLRETGIPVIRTDRGGQITYHGPGQLIVYLLADLKRLDCGPRKIVSILENAIIETLALYGINAKARADAPGVYVAGRKIASLGLRIKRGGCYHGLSLNNNMDLSPFGHINPCGYPDLQVTQLTEHGVNITNHELAVPLVHCIIKAIES